MSIHYSKMTSLFYPAYFKVIQKVGNEYRTKAPTSIVNFSGKAYQHDNRELKHGLSQTNILQELYLRYQGLEGWYLVHMPEREYYYCGSSIADVQDKLYELGVYARE